MDRLCFTTSRKGGVRVCAGSKVRRTGREGRNREGERGKEKEGRRGGRRGRDGRTGSLSSCRSEIGSETSDFRS